MAGFPREKGKSSKSAKNLRAMPVPFPRLRVAFHCKGPGRKNGAANRLDGRIHDSAKLLPPEGDVTERGIS
jgi:hypothetical protein